MPGDFGHFADLESPQTQRKVVESRELLGEPPLATGCSHTCRQTAVRTSDRARNILT